MVTASLSPEDHAAVHRLDHRHLARLGLFVALYASAAWTAVTVDAIAVRLPAYLLAAASLHAISLFTHEGVHGSLARHPSVNAALAAVCAWPVLQNFSAYRVLHLRHHAGLGGPDDPDHYPNYAKVPPAVMAMHWGRLIAGYPAYVTAIPVLAFRHARPRERAAIALELAAVIALAALLVSIPAARPWLIHGWLWPMLIVNTLVNVRGMSQHTLMAHAQDPVLGTRSILPARLVAFFMCNENLHLEHHLYPRVPWYHLPRVHALLAPALRAQQAVFIPSYTSFVVSFVRAWWHGRPVA